MKKLMLLFHVCWISIMLASLSSTCDADSLMCLIALNECRMLFEQRAISVKNQDAVLRQTSEVTCGPAALASLLKFYFGEATSEHELAELTDTYNKGTTTLLGLRESCLAKGYKATGYKMTLLQLIRETDSTSIPILVHFKEPTLHYVLVVGQVGEYILVSDPALGNVSMDKDDFLRRWSNKALVVKSDSRIANRELASSFKKSAVVRLDTLGRAGRIMTSF